MVRQALTFILYEINRSFLSTYKPHFESEGFWKIKNGLIIVDYFCLGHDKKKSLVYSTNSNNIVWNVSHLFALIGQHFRLHQKKSEELLMNKKLRVSTDAFLPEENSRSFQSCCEIKCSMSISFTGCSFTKVTDDTVSGACSFYCIGIARCCNGRITRCFVTDILYLIFLKK